MNKLVCGGLSSCLLLLCEARANATVEAFGMPERRIGDHVIAARLGMDPVPLLELGYIRDGLLRLGQQPLDGGVSLALPLLLAPRARDFRLAFGGSSRLPLSQSFGLSLGAAGFGQRGEDEAASEYALGFEVGVSPRYRTGSFYVGLALRVRSTVVTFINNKSYMRYAYDDRYDSGANNDPGLGGEFRGPRDGAYGFAAWRVFAGVEAGFTLQHWAFAAGLGGWWSPQAQGLLASVETGQIPIYIQLDVRRAL